MKRKQYSTYNNPKSDELNKKPVKKGSVIVSNLSNYEKLPKFVTDHKRESVVVLKDRNNELGVVYLHGKNDENGRSRKKKKEAGIWEEVEKNGQAVYVDLDIRITDAGGNPIKQGKIFRNTGVMLDEKNLEKVEKHIYENNGRKSHSFRNILKKNRDLQQKNKKAKSNKWFCLNDFSTVYRFHQI